MITIQKHLDFYGDIVEINRLYLIMADLFKINEKIPVKTSNTGAKY